MNAIKDFWDDYNEKVINVKAGAVQRLETKRAFYCGALSSLQILLCLPPEVSDDAGAAILEGLRREIIEEIKRIQP